MMRRRCFRVVMIRNANYTFATNGGVKMNFQYNHDVNPGDTTAGRATDVSTHDVASLTRDVEGAGFASSINNPADD